MPAYLENFFKRLALALLLLSLLGAAQASVAAC
jgi:hypothetical protein